jgi:hypothetical protein
MALKKIIELEGVVSVNTPFGIVENGTQRISFFAYICVISVTADKSSAAARVNFKGDLNTFDKYYQVPISTNENSKNFIAQAYDYLKTLPEFSNAIDC